MNQTPEQPITAPELPLLDVFYRLREEADLPIGPDEYFLLLTALRAGAGWQSREALQRLCCQLWAKSADDAARVRRMLDRVLGEGAGPVQPPEVEPPEQTIDDEGPGNRRAGQTESVENPVAGSAAGARQPTLRISPQYAVNEGVNPVEVVLKVRRRVPDALVIGGHGFEMRTDYYPVTERQMKQSWRYLRRLVRTGPPEELDVEATVDTIARNGFLSAPVMVPRQVNKAQLLLLIDRDGSMVPFHELCLQLRDTAQRGGRLGSTNVYYFHDVPGAALHSTPQRVEGLASSEVIARITGYTVALIISDAGAARGYYDEDRVKSTRAFLADLKVKVPHCAWLNPMPIARWANTTAQSIGELLPMFEMSRRGLDAAVSTLQGQLPYWERLSP